MQILSGLFDHMVLQRNVMNLSDAAFAGTSSAAAGTLLATVSRGGRKLTGFSGLKLGAVKAGKFSGRLRGLPAGGPYRIELSVTDAQGRVLDALAVTDVLVGDVWILGGQSNMQGIGDRKDGPDPDPEVRAFFMDDHWGKAADPLHDLSIAVDPVHAAICGGAPGKPGRYCAGPGLSFGLEMKRRLGVPQGLIACAHGGTSMAQWDPKLKEQGGKSLYGAMLRRFAKNGAKVAGMIWYQGCHDAGPEAAPLYTARMKALVAACRRDFGFKDLPFALVQISRAVGFSPAQAVYWNVIQEQQRLLPGLIKRCLCVPAIDLPLDDMIHIGGAGQVLLGRRLAEAMDVLGRGKKGGTPPITLESVTVEDDPDHGTANLRVEFGSVVGGLVAQSRPAGFAVVDAQGLDCVYDVRLDGNRAVVRLTQNRGQFDQYSLHYGRGYDPYCNITDRAGRSLPVFGPRPIAKPRPVTPYITTLRVSGLLPGAGKLHGLELPGDLGALGLQTRSFPERLCNLHPEIAARPGEDLLLFYACALECREDMRLALLLGYDGPVKAWVDGRELFHDPAGTNPAIPDAKSIPVQAAAGRHGIVVALGTNNSAAWGIFLRLERLGLTQARIKAGPAAWGLPTVLG